MMKTPLSLQKPKISESDGLNPNEEPDSDNLKALAEVLSTNSPLKDLTRPSGAKEIKVKNSNENPTAQSSEFNSFGLSTVDSTGQDKKDILDTLNSSPEKKDETPSNFGGSSPNESEISTMISQEGFDSQDKISKVSKLNFTRRDDPIKEFINPINEDLEEEIKAGTEDLAKNPNKSVIPEEEDGTFSDEEIPLAEAKPKEKIHKTRSPKKKAPQSQYKNLYKSILVEIFNIFIIFGSQQKLQMYNTDWDEEILNHQILSTARKEEAKLSEEKFDRWLMANEKDLEMVLKPNRLCLFMLFGEEIKEIIEYTGIKDSKEYFKAYKKKTSHNYLRSLKNDEQLIFWILMVKLSLIWLPKGSPDHEIIQLLPIQKDSLPMFYWIITTKTKLGTKNLLLNYVHREHLRQEFQETFDQMVKSAREKYPQKSHLLDKIDAIHCDISEPHLTIVNRIAKEVQPVTGKEEEPVSELMKNHLAFEAFTDSYYQAYGEMQNMKLKFLKIDSVYLSQNSKMDVEEVSSQISVGQMTFFEEEEAIHREKYVVNEDERRGFMSHINFTGVSDEEGQSPNKKVKMDNYFYN